MMMQSIPIIPSIIIAILLVAGGLISLIGSFGLIRFKEFADRIHAPTLANTLGSALVLLASVVVSLYLSDRVFLHEIIIIIFLFLTSPASAMLLMRSSTLRHERKNS